MIPEFFPSSHILRPHHSGSCIITGDYNQKNCKAQILFKKESLGKPKASRGDPKRETSEEILASDTTAMAKSKHSLTPAQINIKPHAKIYLPQFL